MINYIQYIHYYILHIQRTTELIQLDNKFFKKIFFIPISTIIGGFLQINQANDPDLNKFVHGVVMKLRSLSVILKRGKKKEGFCADYIAKPLLCFKSLPVGYCCCFSWNFFAASELYQGITDSLLNYQHLSFLFHHSLICLFVPSFRLCFMTCTCLDMIWSTFMPDSSESH